MDMPSTGLKNYLYRKAGMSERRIRRICEVSERKVQSGFAENMSLMAWTPAPETVATYRGMETSCRVFGRGRLRTRSMASDRERPGPDYGEDTRGGNGMPEAGRADTDAPARRNFDTLHGSRVAWVLLPLLEAAHQARRATAGRRPVWAVSRWLFFDRYAVR